MWRYQPIKTIHVDGEVSFNVGEVYDDIQGHTTDEIPSGATLEDLIDDLKAMLSDIQRYNVIEYRPKNNPCER